MPHKHGTNKSNRYGGSDNANGQKQFYQAFHEELDMAARDHDSHIPLNPDELFSLPKPWYKNKITFLSRVKKIQIKTHQFKYRIGNIKWSSYLAVNGMIGNFWLISLKMNLDVFIFK